ncbi:MAG: SDR family oxidoreductase [Bacteroidetes bacterium]|nr:SDR family oxidoreductase [Bacteroidota bacterium]MBP8754828.1 SDR family oxidoreductase [Chitinophagales bacterium]MBK8486162.1 SDR family oxidoreductase [Bacteroidota bacterium]MBK8681108.1 SDR family oxidoreductase [Bacteroidota bacterium]MBP9189515.1 SDR family oxidoreductase [Chitinophagales bacterium]
MDLNLHNKNAMVCGSTQGIGLAIAEELASAGAQLILVARNEAKLQEVISTLPAKYGQTHQYITADFNSPGDLKVAVKLFLDKYAAPIHILVNNTGGPASGPITAAHEEEFRIAFNAHLICNHILATALIPGMRESGYGRIINIISTSVKQALPNLGVSNTIRAAVGNWAKTMANELGKDGITVNNVLPGATKTVRLESIIKIKAEKTGNKEDKISKEMLHEIPLGRFAEAADIANAVAFLSSPAAAYITGINLPVDGGRTSCL